MALKGAVAFITQDWNSTMCIVNYEERPMNKNLLLTVGIWAPYTLYKLHNKEIDDMTSHFMEKMIYIKMSLIL